MSQVATPIDEATLDALQARLYPRLEQALLVSMRRERERVPPYYEQYVGSEIRRLEEAIERNGQRIEETSARLDQRIEELRLHIDQRFAQVDQRFAQVDQRFRLETRLDEMNVRFRNWTLAAVAFLGVLTTVLSLVTR